MVSISKWAIIGIGLVAAGLFFKEAAGSSLTGTLNRTGLAGASLGSGIQSSLTGVGVGASQLLNPFFSLVDLFGKAGGLFASGNVETGGGVNLNNNSGGGIASSNIPTSKAGVSAGSSGWSSSGGVTSASVGGASFSSSNAWGG